ncbi:hypothetical protein BMS3Abin15_00768 [bacterium BMS3Abin15]|nr:hypothetical protein BMS3Abin15_00768 [bacterium BMS3Abin15]
MCQQSLINYLHTELTDCHSPINRDSPATLTPCHSRGPLSGNPVVSKEDIETLIHTGEHVSENEIAALIKEQNIKKGKQKTSGYKLQLPESIRSNAALIDEKLADITVCDPAVGSGAFPVGMMSEIVRARNVLSVFLNDNSRTAYEFKRRCIEHSLYGVDIDPGAVEIAKLRLWLSLVVDEDDIENIKPLPNLDYKVVCGNSLLGVEKDLFNNALFNELEKLKPLFFNETNPTRKQEYKKQIDNLIRQITNGHQEFDFEVYFSEVFHEKMGFDVVIGNPPYEEISEKKTKAYFQKNYSDVLSGHYDLYIFFFRKAFSVARTEGIISFITPHTYLHYTQFKNLRKHIYQNSQIIEITNRISGIFESAVVDNSVIFLRKGLLIKNYSTSFASKYLSDGRLLNERTFGLNHSDFNPQSFDINAIRNGRVIERYSKNTIRLADITQSTQGIIVYAKEQGKKVNRFSETKINNNYQPVVKGRDLSRYELRWTAKYIHYGEWLCRARDPVFFKSKKLFFRQTADSIIGTYVGHPMYCIDSVHSFILPQDQSEYDLLYILAILNSKFGTYLYKLFITETGKVFAQVKLTYLRRLPIKVVPKRIQESFISKVNHILGITEDDDYLENPQKQSKVKAIEAEIDQLVYKLYGLTPEEIKIVESSS